MNAAAMKYVLAFALLATGALGPLFSHATAAEAPPTVRDGWGPIAGGGTNRGGAAVVNGGFETGDFTGWNVVDTQPAASTFVYTGAVSPVTGLAIDVPPEGSFAAVADQTGPGRSIVFQDVLVPAGGPVTFQASVYWDNAAAGAFTNDGTLDDVGANHFFRVDIIDPAAPLDDAGPGILVPVFETTPGTVAVQAPMTINADLTPFAGTTVRMRFTTIVQLDFFRAGFDDIRVEMGGGGGGTLVNGDFETGDFSGWSQVDIPAPIDGSWFVYTGTSSPINAIPIEAPPQGNFAATADQNSPVTSILYQDVTVPTGGNVEFQATVYYDNSFAGAFADNGTLDTSARDNHQFRLDILSPAQPVDSVAVLQQVFQTLPGFPDTQAPLLVTADLTPFAGQTVRIRMATMVSFDLFFTSVDDVKLVTAGSTLDNGDFEMGDFTNWLVFEEGSGSLQVYSDPFVPIASGATIPPPPQGNFAAITDMSGPARHFLYRDVAVPASGTSEFRATIYYENLNADFIVPLENLTLGVPNQQFRVDIVNPAAAIDEPRPGPAGVLLNVYDTPPGSALAVGPIQITADLTPFAGTTVRLRFATVYTDFFFHSVVDDVQLVTTTPTGQLSYDFNDGPQGWSLTGLWHATSQCAAGLPGHTLPGTLYFGIDASCSFANGAQVAGTATSPPIEVPVAGAGAVLEFNYLIATENGSPFDNATAEISNDGGMNWTVLDTDTANGGRLVVSGPFSGFGESLWFASDPLDISAFAGQTVLVRFAFDSLDGIGNDTEGFHVDDFEIRPIVPDVEARGITTSANLILGQPAQVRADYENIDQLVGTGSFDVVVYQSSDDQFDGGDVVVGSGIGVGNLGPDATGSYIIDVNPQVLTAPNYLIACAENVATEIDLGDNCIAILIEDGFEDNDTLLDAFVIGDRRGQRLGELRLNPTFVHGPGTAVFGDDDWYEITILPGEQHLILDLRFDHDTSDIDVEIYDVGGFFVAGSFGVTDREFLEVELPGSGTHFVRVYNCCGGGPNLYDFWWTAVPDDLPDLFDFEAGAPGWGLGSLWRVTSDCAAIIQPGHSPIIALGMGQDVLCNYDVGQVFATATSPPIEIPGGALGASLDFNSLLETEFGAPFDLARVLISDDWGFNYREIDSDQANGGGIPITGANLDGQPPVWGPLSYDVSGFLGQTVILRFEFDSVDGGVNAFEGWYVDDVIIDPLLPPDLTVMSVDLSTGSVAQGGTIVITGTMLNAGDLTAAATTGSLHLSADPYIIPADALLPDDTFGGVFPLAALDPAEQSMMMFTVNLDPGIPAGRYWVGICLDADDFENRNNCRGSGSLTITPGPGAGGEGLFFNGFEGSGK